MFELFTIYLIMLAGFVLSIVIGIILNVIYYFMR
jgi:hypothetical protein